MTSLISDRAALLAAIRANPDDDAPRLILADWLDENGEAERAHFVRVCVRAHREDVESGWCIQPHIHHPQKELFALPFAGINYVYSRGFIERITLPTIAAAIGGPCERCSVSEWIYVGMDNMKVIPCPSCKGKKTLPGLLAAIDRHPCCVVREVVAKDKRPFSPVTTGARSYGWQMESALNSAWQPPYRNQRLYGLPDDLWYRLEGKIDLASRSKYYDSEPAALAALSAALLAMVREGK